MSGQRVRAQTGLDTRCCSILEMLSGYYVIDKKA
jgi:hypothetical protein